MENITPSMQQIALADLTATGVIFQMTIPTGAPGRTLQGFALLNGATAATTPAAVWNIYKTSVAAGNLLGTVTWAAAQGAYSGVHAKANSLTTAVGGYGVISTTVTNQFDEGDILVVNAATGATTAAEGFLQIYWE